MYIYKAVLQIHCDAVLEKEIATLITKYGTNQRIEM